METKLYTYLNDRLKIMEYYNFFSPFPIFDTEYVQEVKQMLKEMKTDKRTEYDDIGVIACRHCKSLYIVEDELNNEHCRRCGSVNDVVMYNNIDEYLEPEEEDE